MVEPTGAQRKVIRAYIDYTLLPLIGSVLKKKLTQAALFMRDELNKPASGAATAVDPDAALHACTILEIYLRDKKAPYPVGAVKVIRDYIARTCAVSGEEVQP